MPGASRTKQVLAASLKDLMRTMPLEKISVSDIVDHADIGRNTFYYHFQDKFDLVNWIYQTESAHFFAERATIENWTSSLESLEDYFRENKDFYCNALAYSGQNSLQDYLFDSISRLIEQQIDEIQMPAGERFSADEKHFVGDLVAGAVVSLLTRWAAKGMRDDPHQYRECVRRICNGSLIRVYLNAGSEA